MPKVKSKIDLSINRFTLNLLKGGIKKYMVLDIAKEAITNVDSHSINFDDLKAGKANIKVFGVGGAGCNAITWLFNKGINGATIFGMNTDALHLSSTKADDKILIGKELTRGLGAGGKAEIGREAAKESISENEEFVLLMSDHIFEKDILQNIIKTKIKKSQGLLAIDFKIDQIPDLDDGMKIQCEPTNDPFHKIIKFNKKLKNYQAIDSGIFKFNYSFFNYLEKAFSLEKYSLSDACNLIAKNNNMIGMDIKTNLWLDIDTPEMFNFKKIINKIIFQE